MDFSFFIGKRYFYTKKKRNFVHVISWVSFFGVSIGTAALVLVLSVFNGFEGLVLSMYNSFDPHLKISSLEGKTFSSEAVKKQLIENNDIEAFSFILEEQVLLKYQDKEFIGTVKGVSKSYNEVTNFDSLLIQGNSFSDYENSNIAIVGAGIAYYLSISIGSILDQLEIFVANRNSNTLLHPHTAFSKSYVIPVGIFSVQAEIDQKYIITPLLFVQKLLQKQHQISFVEVKLKEPNKMLQFQKKIQEQLGPNYLVKNRLEQQEFLYKILNTEKFAVFLILTFIMIIAAFNIIGSLSMLILDKRNDIKTLKSFGATQKDIQKIFFSKSILTIFFGSMLGMVIGLGFSILQKSFGFIGMGGGSFVVDAYPVAIVFSDILLIITTVLVIGIIASWYPSKILTKQLFKK